MYLCALYIGGNRNVNSLNTSSECNVNVANTVHVLTWTLQGVKNTRLSYRKPRPRTQRNDRDGIFGISD